MKKAKKKIDGLPITKLDEGTKQVLAHGGKQNW